jgi:hypothetical protein
MEEIFEHLTALVEKAEVDFETNVTQVVKEEKEKI